MQHLSKPAHSRVLRPLQALLLLGIALITSHRKSMLQAWEILIAVLDIQARDNLVGMSFQLWREHIVVLRC